MHPDIIHYGDDLRKRAQQRRIDAWRERSDASERAMYRRNVVKAREHTRAELRAFSRNAIPEPEAIDKALHEKRGE